MSGNNYDIDPIYGCHLWHGKLGSNGRPVIWRGQKPSSAHKIAYEEANGPVKDGLVLDHLCRRVLCVRVAHLEPVTKDENERRKMWKYRAKRMTCQRGHDLKLNAVITPEGGRVCRVCNREGQS